MLAFQPSLPYDQDNALSGQSAGIGVGDRCRQTVRARPSRSVRRGSQYTSQPDDDVKVIDCGVGVAVGGTGVGVRVFVALGTGDGGTDPLPPEGRGVAVAGGSVAAGSVAPGGGEGYTAGGVVAG
jgi:hypothetical protein